MLCLDAKGEAGSFGGHHEDDADREAIKSAFANLLEQLDTALAG